VCDQGPGLCSGCNPWQACSERDERDDCLRLLGTVDQMPGVGARARAPIGPYPELCSGRNRVYLDPRSSYDGFDLVCV
jgi:hypothetical protein